MKISEKLSEIKQKEALLNRQFGLMEYVINKDFDKTLCGPDTTSEYLERKYKEFVAEKKSKVAGITAQIDKLTAEIIAAKNEVNKINIQNGMDKYLIELKYLRIELSKLMKSGGISYRREISVDEMEELGIPERIKTLEAKKNKIEATVQFSNWTKEL